MLAWLHGLLIDERHRWFLWIPVAFGVGIGVYFALPFEPPPWVAPAGLIPTAAAAWLTRERLAVAAPLAAVALALAGASAASVRTALAAAPILAAEHGPADIRGEVVSAEPLPTGHRVIIKVAEISGLAPGRRPERVRLTLRTGEPPLPGRPITVPAMLHPPPTPAAPGGFDFARALYFQRIGALGYAVGPPRLDGDAPAASERRSLAALRYAIAGRIEAAMTAGREDDPVWRQRARVAAALLTGLRAGIDETVWEWLRDSGLAHLLAISGLHLGLVAGLTFFALRLLLALSETLALRRPIKKWAALAALAAGFGYLLLTGATVPTQRAFVMVAMVLAAVLIDREPLTMRPVAWAALIILAWRPESLTGASFQMSFAAVTALVAFYEAARAESLRRAAPPSLWRRPLLYLGAVAATTVVASLATAPFSAWHFNRIAIVGLVANFAAVPATAFWIMPWGMVALLAMPFGLEAPPLEAMGWGIGLVIAVAEAGAGLPLAVASIPAAPASALVATVFGGLWMAIWRRPWRFFGVAGIAAGVAIAVATRGPDLLVDDTGRLFAVRTGSGGLALSTQRTARFAAGVWLRRAGVADAAPWPPEDMACDRLACIFTPQGGPVVALVHDPRALGEDCAVADIVVSAAQIRGDCPAPLVIDGGDVRRNGAHAVRFGDGSAAPRATHARGARGARPWVVPPLSSGVAGPPAAPEP